MQFSFQQHKYFQGVTLVEVMIGIAIFSLIIIFSTNAISNFVNTGRNITEKTQGLYLAEEGLELLRFVRDTNWSNIGTLTSNTTYALSISTTTITVTTTPEIVGSFKRTFSVTNVYRNGVSNDIVASTTGGAIADPNAKYVTSVVSWGVPTTTVSLTTILSDISL